jgi:hypothetical protein
VTYPIHTAWGISILLKSILAFLAPSIITARVQECHMLAGHIICELVESAFLDK